MMLNMKGKPKNQNRNLRYKQKQKFMRANSSRMNKLSLDNINNVININKFRMPIENIKTELKDIKKIIKETETSQEKQQKILIKKENIKIAKENLIMSLRKELKFQKLLNKNLLHFKEYADKNSNEYKKNYEDICKYRTQLHTDLSEFIALVNNYEKQKSEYSNEKDEIIKTNENILHYKNQEQNKMKNRLEQLNYDTQNQYTTLENLRKTLREYREQNDKYILSIENNEYAHDQKYEKLLKEYKRVENEYKYYFDLEIRSRKNNLDRMDKNLCAEEEGLAMLKLSDKQVKGEFLKNIIKDIHSQIQEIEQLNRRIKEDKEIEKLLGKRGAEKFKQKNAEKYKNEISSINTKYNFTLNSY